MAQSSSCAKYKVWDETPRDGEKRLSQLVVKQSHPPPLKGHETLARGIVHHHGCMGGWS